MRVALACLVLLGGCPFESSRVDNDGSIDTSPNADDDNDGIPNAQDNCPTVSNPNNRDHDLDTRGDVCDLCPHIPTIVDTDADADEVGDACDPRPFGSGDKRVGFYGFYDGAEITGWTTSGGFSAINGKLRFENTNGVGRMESPMPLTNVALTAGMIGHAIGNTPSIGVTARRTSNAYFRCSAAVVGGSPVIESLVSETFPINMTVPWSGNIIGSHVISFHVLDKDTSCSVVPQGPVSVANNVVRPGLVGFEVVNVTVDIDFLFVVEMQ